MHLGQLFSDIHWLAVGVAFVANFALGALWYSPALFAKAWMQDVGLTEEAMKSVNMVKTFGGTIVMELIAILGLAAFLGRDATWIEGLHTGLWVGVLWISTAYGITYLFEQRPLRLWMINAGYNIVLYAVTGTIIGAM